jgi:hypothetical protein
LEAIFFFNLKNRLSFLTGSDGDGNGAPIGAAIFDGEAILLQRFCLLTDPQLSYKQNCEKIDDSF